MSNENLSSEQLYKTLLMLWFGLFSSQFIFLVVIYAIKPNIFKFDWSKPLLGENMPIVLAFAFVAISVLVLSLVSKKNFINKAIEEQNVGLIQTALIVGCALCESISLFGFVLAIAFNYQYFLIWFAFGILGMILHFPKRDNLHLATFKKTQNL